jgi:predicted transcriptional regulator of viral defense system
MDKEATYLLEFLDDNGIDIFNKEYLNSNNFSDKSLRKLIDSDFIRVIEKGKYCRHNFADEYVIGNFLAKNSGVAYWTAMNLHGLTEQIPNVVYVQTTQAKENKTIFGVRYRFIRIKKEKLIGFKAVGYGNNEYFITDIEKTIVDCFDLPKYSGGYNEIIKAFDKAGLKPQKMVKYCRAINNIAVTKRLGYLCELLDKPNMDYFIRFAQSIRNEKYNLFESDGDKTGKTNRRWRLIMNMGDDEIVEIAKS